MLAITTSVAAFAPTVRLPASASVSAAAAIQMRADDTFAPEGMGKEFVSQPRKPLSEYVGASHELAAFPGGVMQPWDPMSFSELYKVSGNNPDVAWLREAELKHGRMSMLAIVGVMVQSAGVHFPGNADISFEGGADWATAPTTLPPAAWGQVLGFIGLMEGITSRGLFNLWFGDTSIREPGDLGFGSKMLSSDPAAADKMRLKELKNGRLAMIAIMGVAFNHVLPGAFPGCIYN